MSTITDNMTGKSIFVQNPASILIKEHIQKSGHRFYRPFGSCVMKQFLCAQHYNVAVSCIILQECAALPLCSLRHYAYVHCVITLTVAPTLCSRSPHSGTNTAKADCPLRFGRHLAVPQGKVKFVCSTSPAKM